MWKSAIAHRNTLHYRAKIPVGGTTVATSLITSQALFGQIWWEKRLDVNAMVALKPATGKRGNARFYLNYIFCPIFLFFTYQVKLYRIVVTIRPENIASNALPVTLEIQINLAVAGRVLVHQLTEITPKLAR